jgi:hypothetical protein
MKRKQRLATVVKSSSKKFDSLGQFCKDFHSIFKYTSFNLTLKWVAAVIFPCGKCMSSTCKHTFEKEIGVCVQQGMANGKSNQTSIKDFDSHNIWYS